jgi:hypothetical protein
LNFLFRLIDGLTGEKSVYKKRGEQEPEVGAPQVPYTLHQASVAAGYGFGPPGSGSGSVSPRYVSGSLSGFFYHQAKIVRKTLIHTVL